MTFVVSVKRDVVEIDGCCTIRRSDGLVMDGIGTDSALSVVHSVTGHVLFGYVCG